MTEFESEQAFDQDLESREYICPVCKKQFMLPIYVSQTDYVYKIRVREPKTKRVVLRKCCSYSCYRKGSVQ